MIFPILFSPDHLWFRLAFKCKIVRSKSKVRGSSFKTISAPQPAFDKNPYGTDKTFPAKPKAKTPPPAKPFKYASPGPAPGGCKESAFLRIIMVTICQSAEDPTLKIRSDP